MPTLAKGSNVYRPSQGTYSIASATLQQLPAPGDTPDNESPDLNDMNLVDKNLVDENLVDENADETPPPPPSSEISPTRVSLPSLLAQPAAFSGMSSHGSTPTSAASSSKHKQSALSAVQSSSAGKKQRTNAGASAMDRIKQSLDDFNSMVAKSILVHPERIRPDTSPERRERAVRLLESQEDYLTDDELIAFFDYF